MIALLSTAAASVESAGEAAEESGHSAAGGDAVGDRRRSRRARSNRRMEELIRQAAQGEVLHNDDTSMTVLACAADRSMRTSRSEPRSAPACSPAGLSRPLEGHRSRCSSPDASTPARTWPTCSRQRVAELAPPIQMCDALSRNLPKLPEKLEVIVGHCLAHARRRFVEVTPNFPAAVPACAGSLGKVYGHDATAREQADDAGGALALSPAAQRPGDGRTAAVG